MATEDQVTPGNSPATPPPNNAQNPLEPDRNYAESQTPTAQPPEQLNVQQATDPIRRESETTINRTAPATPIDPIQAAGGTFPYQLDDPFDKNKAEALPGQELVNKARNPFNAQEAGEEVDGSKKPSWVQRIRNRFKRGKGKEKENSRDQSEGAEQPENQPKSQLTPEEQQKYDQIMKQIKQMIRSKKYLPAMGLLTRNMGIIRKKGSGTFAKIRNDLAKKISLDYAKKAINKFLISSLPVWGPPVAIGLIVIIILVFVIGIVIGLTMREKGDRIPATSEISLGSYAPSDENPDGIYLQQMTGGALTVKDAAGNKFKLGMDATVGGYSSEDPAKLKNGVPVLDTPNDPKTNEDPLASPLHKKYNNQTYTQAELDYYMTMRWPYVNTMRWTGTSSKGAISGYAAAKQYAGRKVIIYAPRTKKAVVTIIAEFGPAPWTGVCADKDSNQNTSGNKKRLGENENACVEQKTSWNQLFRQGKRGIFQVPDNYRGRIGGGPPKVGQALGNIGPDELVIVGFAKDQDMPVGPLPITDSDIVKNTEKYNLKISGSGINASLPVPGVTEGVGADCSQASATMIALYYHSNQGTLPKPALASLPAKLKDDLIELRSGDKGDGGTPWFTTETRTCEDNPVSVLGIITSSPKTPSSFSTVVPSDFGPEANRKEKIFEAILNSLKNGHPVLVYAKPDAPYHNSKHILVITGYDENRKQFYWNNPTVGRVAINLLREKLPGEANNPNLDWPTLYNFLGGQSKHKNIFVMNKKCITSATCK